ncbi:hypothetical protein CHS0354_033411 [Potamilus streckersoni]|uniref:Palmitoyltransferase n=1 Tax=Potamilus streckersoni TaxID=2493646 RepID=A0AAE0VKI3_9BIVA|nr:hypothetical protein CHS0354_033411 [Potamilus streckersoni]
MESTRVHSTVKPMEGQLIRKWKVYPGRSKFCWNGRFMCAPDYSGFFCCLALVVVTGALFFARDCEYLAREVTPAIPVIGGLLFIFILGTLCRTTLTDPGVIPRATPEEVLDIEKQMTEQNQNSSQDAANGTYVYQAPRYKEVEIKGRKLKLTFCHTCQMFRPPRASHCSRCNNCVERFDHHCPMVGNCIGKRNYRYFYLFVTSTTIMCLYVLACNVAVIVLRSLKTNVGDAFKESIASVIEGVVCIGSLTSVGGLACYHSYLVAMEMTTNEDIKGSHSSKRIKDNINPFSHGSCFKNCCFIICGPQHPSLMDRRGFTYVQETPGTNQHTNDGIQHV